MTIKKEFVMMMCIACLALSCVIIDTSLVFTKNSIKYYSSWLPIYLFVFSHVGLIITTLIYIKNGNNRIDRKDND